MNDGDAKPFPWHLFELENADEQPTVTVPESQYRWLKDMAIRSWKRFAGAWCQNRRSET